MLKIDADLETSKGVVNMDEINNLMRFIYDNLYIRSICDKHPTTDTQLLIRMENGEILFGFPEYCCQDYRREVHETVARLVKSRKV